MKLLPHVNRKQAEKIEKSDIKKNFFSHFLCPFFRYFTYSLFREKICFIISIFISAFRIIKNQYLLLVPLKQCSREDEDSFIEAPNLFKTLD